MLQLLDMLREIEDITDINGCFFINAQDNIIIESTIPFKMPEEIIWEIGVLKDTFQQFSSGVKHGGLTELMIEGDKGYILLYNVPPYLLLMAMAADDINLSYVKMAMIDILDRIKKGVKVLGDDVLKLPGKAFGQLGAEKRPAPMRPVAFKPAALTAATPAPVVEATPAPVVEATPAPVVEATPTPVVEATPTPVVEATPAPARAIELTPTPISTVTSGPSKGGKNIIEMLNSFSGQAEKQIRKSLKEVFSIMKEEVNTITGVEFSNLLETLKDAILENLGTSLALFDISKTSRELKRFHNTFKPEEARWYQDRIDNWESRIIK